MTEPPVQSVPSAGVVIVATGAVSWMTVSTASELVAAPNGLATTTRKWLPESAAVVAGIV